MRDLYFLAPPQAYCAYMYMLVHSVVISKHSGEPLIRMDQVVHFRYNFGTTEREKKREAAP